MNFIRLNALIKQSIQYPKAQEPEEYSDLRNARYPVVEDVLHGLDLLKTEYADTEDLQAFLKEEVKTNLDFLAPFLALPPNRTTKQRLCNCKDNDLAFK